MSQITNTDKSLEAMKNFAEQYARRTNTYFCSDLSVTAVVIEGLARHKDVQWTHVKCQIQPWMQSFSLSAFMNRDGILGHQFNRRLESFAPDSFKQLSSLCRRCW